MSAPTREEAYAFWKEAKWKGLEPVEMLHAVALESYHRGRLEALREVRAAFVAERETTYQYVSCSYSCMSQSADGGPCTCERGLEIDGWNAAIRIVDERIAAEEKNR